MPPSHCAPLPLGHARLSQLVVFTLVTPIFGVTMGALFLDEMFGWLILLC